MLSVTGTTANRPTETKGCSDREQGKRSESLSSDAGKQAHQEDDGATRVGQLRAWQPQHCNSKELLKCHTPELGRTAHQMANMHPSSILMSTSLSDRLFLHIDAERKEHSRSAAKQR